MRNTNDPGIAKTAEYVLERIKIEPEIGLILGSGLGAFANEVEDAVVISTKDIPGYPESTVEGHAGKLVSGKINDTQVLVVQGRVHFYEGYPMEQIAVPTRLIAALGAKAMIVTNAAGGMGDHLEPGDLMAISDHINMMGTNPLIGQIWGFDRFPDMSNAYDEELRGILHEVAKREGITLKNGVLGGYMGPTYETKAEVHFLRTIGADAACMSTIPEIISAARLKLRAIGVSCITNKATGLSDTPLTHEEVTETAAKVEESFRKLLKETVSAFSKVL
jgi:purine-nucleoside phosphorylase